MRHVVYVSDAKYRPYVDVSAASVRVSASEEIAVHVIDADDPKVAARLAAFPEYHGSRATFAKLLIPELLPDVDWALYLDGDTLALGDVCEVFGCCDETKLIVGSRDPENFNLGPDTETPWLRERGLPTFERDCEKVGVDSGSGTAEGSYFCAGVMLMNLRAMREERILEQCLEFFRQYGIPPLNEQTALNCLCLAKGGKGCALLPPQWGVFSMCPEGVDFTKSAIIHYPQDLPWRRDKPNKLLHDFVWLWWKFVREVGVGEEVGVGSGSGSVVGVGSGSVVGLWRRWVYLVIKACPWLVTWSPYLRARLRPIGGLTSAETAVILKRWLKVEGLKGRKVEGRHDRFRSYFRRFRMSGCHLFS